MPVCPSEVPEQGLADLPPKRNVVAALLNLENAARAFSLQAHVFRSISFVIAGVLAASSLQVSMGCAPVAEDPSVSDQVYRLPWPTDSGTYELQDVRLHTFSEPEKLRGHAAEIIVDPRLSGGRIVGEEPIGRWSRAGSKRVPADFVTLQAATVYAHLEKLGDIDRELGIAKNMNGPSRVGLMARLSDGVSQGTLVNNAIFDGRLDSLFIVPFVGSELPISLNAGIISHEHFHRLFQSIVLSRLRETARLGCSGDHVHLGIRPETSSPAFEPPSEETTELVPLIVLNQAVVRGVNEGFADFWGWAYSQDEEFIGRSLGIREDGVRRLDKPAAIVPLKASLRNSLTTIGPRGAPVLKSEAGRISVSYRLGTEYARIFRGLVDALIASGVSKPRAVAQVRQALALSLDALGVDISTAWGKTELEPELMLRPAIEKLLRTPPNGTTVMNAAAKKSVCKELDRVQASAAVTSGLCSDLEP